MQNLKPLSLLMAMDKLSISQLMGTFKVKNRNQNFLKLSLVEKETILGQSFLDRRIFWIYKRS